MPTKKFIERTLLVFKPDAIQRGIMGEILMRFEHVGLKIVGMKMIQPDREHYRKHYEDIGQMLSRRGEHALNNAVNFMSQGPVIAAVLEGVEAIEIARKLTGATEPKAATIGTIRGDYSHMSYDHSDVAEKSIGNLIHTSSSRSDAEQEIKLWFNENELYDYQTVHEKFTC